MDRDDKASLYARAGIADCWIIDNDASSTGHDRVARRAGSIDPGRLAPALIQ